MCAFVVLLVRVVASVDRSSVSLAESQGSHLSPLHRSIDRSIPCGPFDPVYRWSASASWGGRGVACLGICLVSDRKHNWCIETKQTRVDCDSEVMFSMLLLLCGRKFYCIFPPVHHPFSMGGVPSSITCRCCCSSSIY